MQISLTNTGMPNSQLQSTNADHWGPIVSIVPGIVSVRPLPSDEAKVCRCLDNVERTIGLRGGSAVYGWAFADGGPISVEGQSVKELYRRWVNHVIWADHLGNLWEVTPMFDLIEPERIAWGQIEFLPDPTAAFQLSSDGILASHPSRYVALCQEGEEVTHTLNLATRETSADRRAAYLNDAVANLTSLGYRAPKWRADPRADRVGIWLFVE